MNVDVEILKNKILFFYPKLDEKKKRQYLASEAEILGYGGVTVISRITGVSRDTIIKGIKENKLEKENGNSSNEKEEKRTRKVGGGRKSVSKHKYPDLDKKIIGLVDTTSKGDPMNPLLWTSKSLRKIQKALAEQGINVSLPIISNCLYTNNYSLQSNVKELSVYVNHEDRNKQFEYINEKCKEFQNENQPVISIDGKKKENVGNFKAVGQELCKIGEPVKVLDHDYVFNAICKATPYGVYDIYKNLGFVNVGISADTSEFSSNSIDFWINNIGIKNYPSMSKLLITADSGGSNGYRIKLWKWHLQRLANKYNIEITMLHFPPGTSKWNKIEHKLFSFISKNWRGKVLGDLSTVISLIGSTTTEKGLKVECRLDENNYEKGLKIEESEYEKINIIRHEFHGEWNYTFKPKL